MKIIMDNKYKQEIEDIKRNIAKYPVADAEDIKYTKILAFDVYMRYYANKKEIKNITKYAPLDMPVSPGTGQEEHVHNIYQRWYNTTTSANKKLIEKFIEIIELAARTLITVGDFRVVVNTGDNKRRLCIVSRDGAKLLVGVDVVLVGGGQGNVFIWGNYLKKTSHKVYPTLDILKEKLSDSDKELYAPFLKPKFVMKSTADIMITRGLFLAGCGRSGYPDMIEVHLGKGVVEYFAFDSSTINWNRNMDIAPQDRDRFQKMATDDNLCSDKCYTVKYDRVRECWLCKKQDLDLRKCSRCKSVWYCNSKCQKADWPTHKTNCR